MGSGRKVPKAQQGMLCPRGGAALWDPLTLMPVLCLQGYLRNSDSTGMQPDEGVEGNSGHGVRCPGSVPSLGPHLPLSHKDYMILEVSTALSGLVLGTPLPLDLGHQYHG